jgi:hypothetical protein
MVRRGPRLGPPAPPNVTHVPEAADGKCLSHELMTAAAAASVRADRPGFVFSLHEDELVFATGRGDESNESPGPRAAQKFGSLLYR